ncbi:armadillo-type protein [Globomyces pollinis-pini]|nr:armadillo-type protein [Globomyces pollinis-pini]
MWTPNQLEFNNLISLLADAQKGDSGTQKRITEQLNSYSLIPEFNNYLACAFSTQSIPPEIRAMAGLLLKNNLRKSWDSIQPDYLAYMKSCVLATLSDPVHSVNNVAGSIITTSVANGKIDRWPEVLLKLIEMLQVPETVMGAFGALDKICEDSAADLDAKDPNFVTQLIQHILQHIRNPNPTIRAKVLKCTNQFLMIRSNSVWSSLNEYMDIIYQSTNDPDPSVKRYVCQAFNQIVELNPQLMVPVLESVINFMILQTQSDDKELALEAADFWLIFCEQDILHVHIQQYLPMIIPVLLKCTIYTDDEIAMLELQTEADVTVADRDQDIKPRFHKQKNHELAGEKDPNAPSHPHEDIDGEEDDDEDDDDEFDFDDDFTEEWNLRKCTAAAVDMLANIYTEDILEVLLPEINNFLQHPDWQTKEAGILALGAIAQGCMAGMKPHLPAILPHLISLLHSEKALIRSITCWTLGRYASWIADPEPPLNAPGNIEQHLQTYMVPMLRGLLTMCLDNNKEVQKAGCSALATLEEEARERLLPFIDDIVTTFAKALQVYQRKNCLVLFDALGIFCEFMGQNLNQPHLLEKFIPPLLQKWSNISNDDYDLFPLFECIGSVAIALGPGFAPYAAPIWNRNLELIKITLMRIDEHKRDPDNTEIPDKDFLVITLDMLGGLIQGLGMQIEPLINGGEPSLIFLLKLTMQDETADVRSSSFAVLGDLAMYCFPTIVPHMNDLMTAVLHNILPQPSPMCISSMNNATWAAGEICLKHGGAMEPYANALLSKLIPLLLNKDTPRSLTENTSITIGRLGLVVPQLVAPHLGQFAAKWCDTLSKVHDNGEKLSAFEGFCVLIKQNPEPLIPALENFCEATLKWNINNQPQLRELFLSIFMMYRNAMGDHWQNTIATFSPFVQSRLREVYGL